MNRSSTERGAVALTALCAAIAVSGCDDVGKEAPRALAPSPTATPSPDADAATVTGGEAYYPPWLEIDTELVEKHLTHLEGREPPTGLTGAPGWDMEWCMDQLGWRVTAHDDGDGFGYEGVTDQAAAMDSAMEACHEYLGYRHRDPFTEEYLTLDFDNKLDIADCLRRRGFHVDDPPSREVYVEQTIADRWTAWNVHEHVPDNRLPAAQEQCPGRPGWEIFVEIGQ